MNVPNTILALLGGIALTLFSLWFGQNHHLLPVSATATSSQVDGLFNTMLTISMGLFLLVQGALIYAVFRFRRQPGDDTDGPPIRGNVPLEVLWTSIPALTILGIAIYSFEVYTNMGGLDPMAAGSGSMAMHHHGAPSKGMAIAAPLTDAPQMGESGDLAQATTEANRPPRAGGIGASPDAAGKPADLVVDVQALQYAWLFTYPGGVLTGELHLPSDRDVQLNITAQDVLHAFWVPQFRLKQDAVPGRTTELRFRPTVVGQYPIVCAELCGTYHGAMRADLIVESPADFDQWLASVSPAPEGSTAQTKAKPKTAIAAQPVPANALEAYSQTLGVSPRAIADLANAAEPQP